MFSVTTVVRSAALCFVMFLAGCSCCSIAPTPAFPGAEGYGKFTVGGREGRVFIVDSLADDAKNPAAGTLRYALNQSGPRTVVFAVAGVIHLADDLHIREGNLTLAGESSPGGIAITGASLLLDADQVIIRHLRFRLGAHKGEKDAATGRFHHNIIIDHCSFSWATDEVASFYHNRFFTLQYSIVSESLNRAGHHKGAHGYGGIWGGAPASFHHNLLAHHTSRNPRINGYRLDSPNTQADELVELTNNVIFNWGKKSAYGNEDGKLNLINNYFKPGPAKGPKRFFEMSAWQEGEHFGQMYIAGNVMAGEDKLTRNNVLGIIATDKDKQRLDPQPWLASEPFTWWPAADGQAWLPRQSAEQAYRDLIIAGDVGANRSARGYGHDPVDARILREVESGKVEHGNGIIDAEDQVIDWQSYSAFFATEKNRADKDGDGLPDDWEEAHGITSATGFDLSPRYTNIEIYLHELAGVAP